MKLRRILVAVEFPGEADQPGLDKAIALALDSGARLEVLHIAYDPGAGRHGGGTAQRDVEYVLGLRRAQLERLVEGRRKRGLRIGTRVEWGRPAHELIGTAAAALKADLVVGQSTRRGVARHVLTYTDWQLIRHADRPLLLVKGADSWQRRAVIAAIDPLHAHDKPAAAGSRDPCGRGVAGPGRRRAAACLPRLCACGPLRPRHGTRAVARARTAGGAEAARESGTRARAASDPCCGAACLARASRLR